MTDEYFDRRHRAGEVAEKKTKLWGTSGTRFELQQELRRAEEQRKEQEATEKASESDNSHASGHFYSGPKQRAMLSPSPHLGLSGRNSILYSNLC